MTEIEAKVSYVKLARSLKTYGVSFFLVKVNVTMSQMSSVISKQHCARMVMLIYLSGKNERQKQACATFVGHH